MLLSGGRRGDALQDGRGVDRRQELQRVRVPGGGSRRRGRREQVGGLHSIRGCVPYPLGGVAKSSRLPLNSSRFSTLTRPRRRASEPGLVCVRWVIFRRRCFLFQHSLRKADARRRCRGGEEEKQEGCGGVCRVSDVTRV